TESLLNSQLFCHRRGAFTGAVADSPGAFETASGGTLFLDEIGELPGQMQSSLLRVLQEKEIVRLGDSRARKVDVRVVAATNRDLVEEVRNGRFRQDLLYRIKVGRIEVPPLRQRKEDIPALAASFLARGRVESGKLISTVSSAAMEVLKSHDWPGNVRELRNAIDYAIIRCSRGDTLQPDHLPPEVQNQSDPIREPIDEVAPTSAVDERARIQEALHKAAGNRNKAAKLLGISRATLYRRLERYGIGPKFPR
ncbi:MAG: sigma 54-interacting transcriptional regulator, partial [Myxococcota bacterium]